MTDPFTPRRRRARPRETPTPAPPPGWTIDEQPPLERMRKADLVRLAADRGLPTDGTRAELIARLTGG